MAQSVDCDQHVLHHVFRQNVIEDTAADTRSQDRHQRAQKKSVGLLVAILRTPHQTGPCMLKGERIGHAGATIRLEAGVRSVIRQTFLPDAASMAVRTVAVSNTCGNTTGSPPFAG